jgi:hypothetical protein
MKTFERVNVELHIFFSLFHAPAALPAANEPLLCIAGEIVWTPAAI